MASRKNMFVSKLKLMLHIHTWPNGKPNLKKKTSTSYVFYNIPVIAIYTAYQVRMGIKQRPGKLTPFLSTYLVLITR